jgi:hypothetical protein
MSLHLDKTPKFEVGWHTMYTWSAIWNAMDRLWPNGVPDYETEPGEELDHPRDEYELAEWAEQHPDAFQRLVDEIPFELPPLTR